MRNVGYQYDWHPERSMACWVNELMNWLGDANTVFQLFWSDSSVGDTARIDFTLLKKHHPVLKRKKRPFGLVSISKSQMPIAGDVLRVLDRTFLWLSNRDHSSWSHSPFLVPQKPTDYFLFFYPMMIPTSCAWLLFRLLSDWIYWISWLLVPLCSEYCLFSSQRRRAMRPFL